MLSNSATHFLDFTETWEYFITCFPPQFISVPYLTTALKISNLAFFAFLKRIFPPTIVLWLEMLTVLSPTRFYQMYLFIALEIFQNKNNMIWHQKKFKQGLLKSFSSWTEERYFLKKIVKHQSQWNQIPWNLSVCKPFICLVSYLLSSLHRLE